MYRSLVRTVAIPYDKAMELGGRIQTYSNGYVYYCYDAHWDNDAKQTKETRASIGHIDSKDKNTMFPGKNFEKYFGIIDEELHRLKQKFDEATRREAGKFHYEMEFASYVALHGVLIKTGALDALQRAYPNDWKKIEAVACHAVIAYNDVAQDFPYWQFDHYCGLDNILDDSSISKLYSKIGSGKGKRNIFFSLYRKNYKKAFPGKKERINAFDSTNQVTESKNQQRAKKGKSKTGEKLPITNTAYYSDEETGIPLWYEHFDGNVLDKSQTPYSARKARKLGFDKLFAFMDRGYYSEACMKSLNELDVGFGMMVPEIPDFVVELIDKWGSIIKDNDAYFILDQRIYGVQTTAKVGENEYYTYVYYDPETHRNEEKNILDGFDYWLAEANKRVRYTEKMATYFEKHGIIITKTEKDATTGKNFTATHDIGYKKQLLQYSGFFVVISNRKMEASRMIFIARLRDVVEKVIKHLKSHFGLSRTYSHGDATYEGKMFVAFIALIMVLGFLYFEESLLHRRSPETMRTLLGELHRYLIHEGEDGKWEPSYAAGKLQKEILSLLDITEEDLIKMVSEVAIIIANE